MLIWESAKECFLKQVENRCTHSDPVWPLHSPGRPLLWTSELQLPSCLSGTPDLFLTVTRPSGGEVWIIPDSHSYSSLFSPVLPSCYVVRRGQTCPPFKPLFHFLATSLLHSAIHSFIPFPRHSPITFHHAGQETLPAVISWSHDTSAWQWKWDTNAQNELCMQETHSRCTKTEWQAARFPPSS